MIAIFVLLIIGVGVKAALVPLHSWLPQAMVAPAPVSALLHAVAVVKAGAFGIILVVYDVFGVEVAAALGVTGPLAAVAAITILYGSLRALFQDDLKRRLAFRPSARSLTSCSASRSSARWRRWAAWCIWSIRAS